MTENENVFDILALNETKTKPQINEASFCGDCFTLLGTKTLNLTGVDQ